MKHLKALLIRKIREKKWMFSSTYSSEEQWCTGYQHYIALFKRVWTQVVIETEVTCI